MVSETGSGETEAKNVVRQCCRLASCQNDSVTRVRGEELTGEPRDQWLGLGRQQAQQVGTDQSWMVGGGGQCAAGKLRQPYLLARSPALMPLPLSYAKHYATAESEKKLLSLF